MENYKGKKVLVRSAEAGVYIGTMVDMQGEQVELANVRNIWSWEGASCLSQIANCGIKGGRVSPIVKSMVINRCCQVMPLTEEAILNLESQPIYGKIIYEHDNI